FFLLLVVEVGTQSLRASVILYLSTRLHLQLAANLFQHLVRLPITWFQRRHLGDVLSRFSSVDAVREIISTGLVTALVDGLMAVIMLLIMFLYDVRLTLIVLGILALYILLRLLLFPTLRRLSQESIANHALCETSFIETTRGMQTVKLLQRENERQAQWQNRLTDAMNSDIRVAKLGICCDAANRTLFGLENILVVYFAALSVIDNVLSLGMLFAFISYKQRFTSAIDSLVDQLIELLMLGLHLERVSDIALSKPEPQGVSSATPRNRHTGGLRLEGKQLAFRYSDAEPWIFRDVNLSIPAGSSIALVGPSGCGKTTLLKCLMGLMPTTEGELTVNGVPVDSRQDYRSLIACVMQDDQLLSGSIAENIACFEQRLDLERVVQVAQQACVHEAIMQMPMQYNTPVGDMGSTLSGGQVQRIMLARALYRQPRVLFLDEATSHLDVETELKINKHIATMNITRIVVAHRPDTIASADQVFELRRECRDV
ncbi:MAG: peptidase domain-containing ABC transporter, partial [Halieaceae bacterium]|nr:peptidase domain-containing ABC transporter [Halieaceae bacterium]